MSSLPLLSHRLFVAAAARPPMAAENNALGHTDPQRVIAAAEVVGQPAALNPAPSRARRRSVPLEVLDAAKQIPAGARRALRTAAALGKRLTRG